MKRKTNLLIAAIVCICATITPAASAKAAPEPVTIYPIVQTQTTDPVTEQKINDMVNDAQNYANYLSRLAENKKETKRIKKEIVDNYLKLGQTDPGFAALIPAAKTDLDAAKADYKEVKKAAKKAQTFVNSGAFIRAYARLTKDIYKCHDDAGRFVMTAIGIPTVY